jgi:hypothetical protein
MYSKERLLFFLGFHSSLSLALCLTASDHLWGSRSVDISYIVFPLSLEMRHNNDLVEHPEMASTTMTNEDYVDHTGHLIKTTSLWETLDPEET